MLSPDWKNVGTDCQLGSPFENDLGARRASGNLFGIDLGALWKAGQQHIYIIWRVLVFFYVAGFAIPATFLLLFAGLLAFSRCSCRNLALASLSEATDRTSGHQAREY